MHVTGAVTAAYNGGLTPAWVLELLFALIMLQPAYFALRKKDDEILMKGSPIAQRLQLGGELPSPGGGVLVQARVQLVMREALLDLEASTYCSLQCGQPMF
jgi:hypothetical protein